jgi:hypothetical protein
MLDEVDLRIKEEMVLVGGKINRLVLLLVYRQT